MITELIKSLTKTRTPILELQRFNGTETYKLEECLFNFYRDDNNQRYISLRVQSAAPIKTMPDTKELNALPIFEMRFPVEDKGAGEPGSVYKIKSGYDEKKNFVHSNFYYTEHSQINNMELKFIEIEDLDTFNLEVYGEVVDVNYYDGSKPPTKIIVKGIFKRSMKETDWGIF